MISVNSTFYEKHIRDDPNFPFTFHPAYNNKTTKGFFAHWHEHMELLCFLEGNANMLIDNSQINAQKGDVIVVNSNCIHSISQKTIDCIYYCLIIDKLFLDSFFAPIQDIVFNEVIVDKRINDLFDAISYEMSIKQSFYKQTVRAQVSTMLSILSRDYSTSLSNLKDKVTSRKLNMVKKAIDYISANYKENITIDDIVSDIGFSKYYFCHTFKEITGQTAFDYINILRCNQAKKLMGMGKYNISESALMSGFNNFSYFTRTYKKHMGILPSQDIKE